MSATKRKYRVRVGSFNVFTGTSDRVVLRGLRSFIDECDMGGLQEFGARRDLMITMRAEKGINFAKPPNGKVVFWDMEQYARVSVKVYEVAPRMYVGRKPGRKSRAYNGPLYATVATLRHRETGRIVRLVNWHAPSGVQFRPSLRRKMYRIALRNLIEVLDLGKENRDDLLFIVADWNWALDSKWGLPVRVLRRYGLVPMYRGTNKTIPTRDRRRIDGAFSYLRALWVKVLDLNVGDHNPSIGCYEFEGGPTRLHANRMPEASEWVDDEAA